jgi:hypothetical protein
VSGAKYTVITNTGVTKGQSGQRPSETRKISTAAPPPDVASPPASASATLSSEAISGFGDGFNASEAVKTIAIEDGLVTDVCAASVISLFILCFHVNRESRSALRFDRRVLVYTEFCCFLFCCSICGGDIDMLGAKFILLSLLRACRQSFSCYGISVDVGNRVHYSDLQQ